LVAVFVCAGLFITACSDDKKEGIDVFAAASLTKSFNEIGAANPELDATFNFAGSSALVTQIQEGGDADVFASADEKNMQTLVDAGMVETPVVFAKNELVIAVQPGNPKNITGLADLLNDDVKLVLAEESVPAGNYARQAFAKAALAEPQPVSNELDVKATLAKLTTGEADAVIVYVTDVQAVGDEVESIEIPATENIEAVYPIAVLKDSKNKDGAHAFVDAVMSDAGQDILESNGFLPPS
jgi:molybdate transport system substrate-binding protein